MNQKLPFDHVVLHNDSDEVVRQYSSGLLTDLEFLHCCEAIKREYDKIDLTGLRDPNTGLRLPATGYKPFG